MPSQIHLPLSRSALRSERVDHGMAEARWVDGGSAGQGLPFVETGQDQMRAPREGTASAPLTRTSELEHPRARAQKPRGLFEFSAIAAHVNTCKKAFLHNANESWHPPHSTRQRILNDERDALSKGGHEHLADHPSDLSVADAHALGVSRREALESPKLAAAVATERRRKTRIIRFSAPGAGPRGAGGSEPHEIARVRGGASERALQARGDLWRGHVFGRGTGEFETLCPSTGTSEGFREHARTSKHLNKAKTPLGTPSLVPEPVSAPCWNP